MVLFSHARRWTRISVRTLLLIFTILAFWFGFEANRIRRQRIAISVVQQLGGQVNFDYQVTKEHVEVIKSGNKSVGLLHPFWKTSVQPSEPVFLRSILGNDFFRRVENIDLSFSEADDSDLEPFARVRSLRAIDLRFTKITDDGLDHLSGLTNLRSLGLSGTQISDDGLRHLSELSQLETLSLSGCTGITGEGFEHLHKLQNLKGLFLGKGKTTNNSGKSHSYPATQVTDNAIQWLKPLKGLQYLTLSETISDEAEMELQDALPNVSIFR